MLLPSQKDVRRQRTERFPWRQHRSLLDPGARFREPAESRVLIATFASSAHSSGDSVWTSSRRPGDRFTVGRVRTFSAMSHSGPGPGWFPSRRPRGRRTNRALQRADDALANSPWGRSRLYSLLSLCVSVCLFHRSSEWRGRAFSRARHRRSRRTVPRPQPRSRRRAEPHFPAQHVRSLRAAGAIAVSQNNVFLRGDGLLLQSRRFPESAFARFLISAFSSSRAC